MLRFVRRHLIWMVVMLFWLTGCEPVEDLGEAIGDLLKSLPSP
jgi:hypothetical protein